MTKEEIIILIKVLVILIACYLITGMQLSIITVLPQMLKIIIGFISILFNSVTASGIITYIIDKENMCCLIKAKGVLIVKILFLII